MWDEVEPVLKVVQTAACLEVVNSLIGLVKSPWQTALMQGKILKPELCVLMGSGKI
jgi:hypothetical protein